MAKKGESSFTKNLGQINMALMVVVLIVVLFNSAQLSSMQTGSIFSGGSSSSSDIIPTGVPEIYGEELQITYDGVSASNPQLADATIKVMADIDKTLTLEGADLDRYIEVLYVLGGGTSCEFCCGARSVIFENGDPACGCAHSYAMRGLTKYLITEHPDEFTDLEILEEVGKWKVLFFPGQMEARAAVMAEQGIEFNYVNVASNKYRGIEQGETGGGMVGGC